MNRRRIEIHEREATKNATGKPNWNFPEGVTQLNVGQIYWVTGESKATHVLFDSILQDRVDSAQASMARATQWAPSSPSWVIDVRWRPGVTDNRGQAAAEAMDINLSLGKNVRPQSISSGDVYYIHCLSDAKRGVGRDLADYREILSVWAQREIANPLVQTISVRSWEEHLGSSVWLEACDETTVDRDFEVGGMVDSFSLKSPMEDWLRWSQENSWALDRAELEQVRDYFLAPKAASQRFESGLPESPTDVEMEVIAQTWSEHCKHKIFAANVDYRETNLSRGLKPLGAQKINGLFKSEIVRATREVEARRSLTWLSSTFSDNAGMVRFDDAMDVSIKVETHNSPSALDPYGGALTGILGVNRDILGVGMGARPIANTDVLCFGMPDWNDKEVERLLPAGLKHPRRVMEGVHRGIQDGGNKSGIPVVNGAFVFDEGYCGKPLVYCGTIGVSPATLSDGTSGSQKRVQTGDLIVMAGGRVGKDGIHGATFSSLELNEGSPQSAVQIGDPLTQKRLADFILAARDLGLYSGITDNGAGGLSSSVGEMALFTGGCELDVSLVPLKYPGLKPWEIMVSESQERMTVAVATSQWTAFFNLAQQHGVEVTRLGSFDHSGDLKITWHGRLVGCLKLDFLHKELRPMNLQAVWSGPQKKPEWVRRRAKKLLPKTVSRENFGAIAQEILGRPNVASKEHLVRRFDHEVQAATVGKPFTGVESDGPADAGVIWLKPHGAADPFSGVAIASGLNSKIAHIDTYISAQISLDEAVRNLICSGGDPDETCLVDNFCWPDPLPGTADGQANPDHAHKAGQLVRACRGLSDAAIAWGMPFVSGKDSMKNDFSGIAPDGRRVKISVPPTVLITAMGKVPDVRNIVSSDFKKFDDAIYVVGPMLAWPLEGSEFAESYRWEVAATNQLELADYPEFNLIKQQEIYRKVHRAMKAGIIRSCHDVSDGGLFVTLAESVIGGRIGAKIDSQHCRSLADLFHEGPGRLLVSVGLEHEQDFAALMAGQDIHRIGVTCEGQTLRIASDNGGLLELGIHDLTNWWKVPL